MLSIVYLPVFIILVYVSGSAINEIEASLPSIIQSTERTFIRSTGRQAKTPTTLEAAVALRTKTTTTTTSASSLATSSSVLSDTAVIVERSMTTLPGSISTSSTTPITRIISASSIEAPTTTVSTSPVTAPSPTTITISRLVTAPRIVAYQILPTRRTTTTTYERGDYYGTTLVPGASGTGYLNVTSQSGTHAYLPCNVKQLVKKPVSWIRVRDGHILTVDQTTFIADQRFQSILSPNPERWSLQIKYVQPRDAGWYECQVSTEPKMSARVRLQVVEPKTEPFGEVNRHVKAGSQVTLRCIVKGALEPPHFFNWYYDKKQIFLNNPPKRNSWRTEIEKASFDDGYGNSSSSSISDDKQNTVASLIIPSVTKKDSGNYTCSPSNSESITFVLHVLNGEYSASAIMSRSCDSFRANILVLIVVTLASALQIGFRMFLRGNLLRSAASMSRDEFASRC